MAAVIAGFATGIAFVVIFAVLSQQLPLRLRVIDPATLSDAAGEELFQLGSKVKIDDTPWQFYISNVIVAENDRVYITGGETVPPPTSGHGDNSDKVFFTKSDYNGLSFDKIEHISNGIYAGDLEMDARGDTIYLMWFEHVGGDNSEIFFTKSIDGGNYMGSVVNVSRTDTGSFHPQMAVSEDGNSVYVVWSEEYQYSEPQKSAILFSSSNDGGESFSTPVPIVNATASFSCPQIAIHEDGTGSSSEIYVVWRQDPSPKNDFMSMFVSMRDDAGNSFSKPFRLSTAATEDYSCPQLALHDDDAYVLWSQTRIIPNPYLPSEAIRGDSDIIFRAVRDGGKTIGPVINLSRGIGDFTTEPAMAVGADGDIYVAWRDTIPIIDMEKRSINYYGNAEVVFTKSEDGGESFTEPVNMSNNQSGSYEPEIAVYGDNVYIIWLESEFPSNTAETKLRISDDGGKSFVEAIVDITGRMEEPYSRPFIVSSPVGDRIFIAWSARSDPDDFNVDGYILAASVASD